MATRQGLPLAAHSAARMRSSTIGIVKPVDYLVAALSQRIPHMIEKKLLVPARVRRPPKEGFSWIDRRFLREHAAKLTGDAVMLYFFLAAVSDQHGLWRAACRGQRA